MVTSPLRTTSSTPMGVVDALEMTLTEMGGKRRRADREAKMYLHAPATTATTTTTTTMTTTTTTMTTTTTTTTRSESLHARADTPLADSTPRHPPDEIRRHR